MPASRSLLLLNHGYFVQANAPRDGKRQLLGATSCSKTGLRTRLEGRLLRGSAHKRYLLDLLLIIVHL